MAKIEGRGEEVTWRPTRFGAPKDWAGDRDSRLRWQPLASRVARVMSTRRSTASRPPAARMHNASPRTYSVLPGTRFTLYGALLHHCT